MTYDPIDLRERERLNSGDFVHTGHSRKHHAGHGRSSQGALAISAGAPSCEVTGKHSMAMGIGLVSQSCGVPMEGQVLPSSHERVKDEGRRPHGSEAAHCDVRAT